MSIEYISKEDKWVKCINTSGTIRAVAISAADISNKMSEQHGSNEIATKALSEATIATLLLSSYCKTGEKVNLNIKGSGWCSHGIVDANADAVVRGYVIERDPKEIQLAKGVGPWGIGLLSVLRTKHEQSQPYIGTVPLLTGHLAKDLTFYWLQSEQVQSAVGIDVRVENGKVILAEGFLIQAMPGATDADIQFIEEHLKKLHQFDSKSDQRKSPINLLSFLLENQTFSVLEEKQLTYACPCSFERAKRSMVLVGSDELKSMLTENKDIEVLCDFCSEKYKFAPKIIQELINQEKK